ncbi:tetratricopeptide repeat protein [Marinobacter confluentis]|uniref:Uncharacterized protein n=1 Tax=Marinobacter confluentis TaxID=1697557 RepID=A0A4Z1C9D6_9GAMM|nr:hypothetical protein [Marinobacter confluentis]TGN39976.1 hypothetical protein E5Q11_06675 [Marinobacter confluentis]
MFDEKLQSIGSQLLLIAFCWVVILVLGYFVYSPALSGPFLFDDYGNLKSLGLYGGVTDWETFKSFVFGGFSGPTGRPISLLTFLLDATNWPAPSAGFKHTNLLFHLFNGTLVFVLAFQILQVFGRFALKRSLWLAFIVASLWLLHPYLISTTMYVVQRMAMLSAMFCLLGMISYLYFRKMLPGKPMAAYAGMTLSIGIFTILATFSKENGAVLPVLILCLEATVIKSNASFPPLNRAWKWLAFVVPSLVLAYMLLKGPFSAGWFQDYATRDFSPYQRLLTQFRVTLSYLLSWLSPSVSGGQIFYDDITVSKSILSPVITLPALVMVVGLILMALWKRSEWPVLSFVILFYFASLAIESTTIGLEMKFDHRVYLGSVFILLPVIAWTANNLRPALKVSASIVTVLVLASLTYFAASLWGNYQHLTMVWATKHPTSVRSQTEAAQMLFSYGRPADSRELLNQASERIPDNFRLRLTQVLVQCVTGGVKNNDLDSVKALARTGPYRHTDFNLLSSLLTRSGDPNCKGVNQADARDITGALLESSDYTSRRNLAYAHLHYYHGLVLLRAGEQQRALELLNEALESRSSLHMRMNIASYKASAGLYQQALEDAKFVEKRLESGEVTGRAAVESPQLKDVKHFIDVVEQDIASAGPAGED